MSVAFTKMSRLMFWSFDNIRKSISGKDKHLFCSTYGHSVSLQQDIQWKRHEIACINHSCDPDQTSPSTTTTTDHSCVPVFLTRPPLCMPIKPRRSICPFIVTWTQALCIPFDYLLVCIYRVCITSILSKAGTVEMDCVQYYMLGTAKLAWPVCSWHLSTRWICVIVVGDLYVCVEWVTECIACRVSSLLIGQFSGAKSLFAPRWRGGGVVECSGAFYGLCLSVV